MKQLWECTCSRFHCHRPCLRETKDDEKSKVVSGRKKCWICQRLAAGGQTEKKRRCWE
ncbi:unnamed protein product [Tetraodon nigroviridis]|uniref:(spotted green pufferfish) hypothetical protein n=1 Tax=Tetraodon nigroviridis TaxID=99883 RepID=Q4S847_TETNG|nr:unnamed protein product [Tetraodon nigroviridis]